MSEMMKVVKRRNFTKQEDDYILSNYSNSTISQMAKHLGRNPTSVRTRMEFLGLEIKLVYRPFTDQEDEFVITHSHWPVTKLAEKLGRPYQSVTGRRFYKLKVKRDYKKAI